MKTYSLSQSQLGIYLEYIQHPELMQYNLPYHFRFSRNIDTEKIKRAIMSVIDTYPAFKTRVITQNGELRQYSDPELQIDVPVIHISEEEVEQQVAQFIRPFDLHKDALSRFLLIETPVSLHFLSDVHHIITDGSSNQMMIRYVALAYNNLALPQEQMSLYEYAEQESQTFDTPSYKQAAAYYKEKFEGAEMTKLSEKPNPEKGRLEKFSKFISKSSLNDFCAQHEVKPSWLFMSAFGITLSKFSRAETIAYTTINHGRHNKKLLDSLGIFVKTVPVLMKIDERQPVIDFIKSHQEELRSTISHGVYPFTHFCQQLGIKPELTFIFQGPAIKEEFHFLDENIKMDQPLATGLSAEKPSIEIFETNTEYEIRLKYVDSQYEDGYMQRFAEAMATCIEQLVTSTDKLLKDISIVSDTEQQNLITLGTGEELIYDRTETFIDLFLKQVALHPDSTAVVDEVSSITYAELDRQSDLLAHTLVASGVGTDTFVAVMLPRRKEFLVSVIAVFKTGGAYIPLDNDYPNDRLLYMLDDSAAKVLTTTHELLDQKRTEGDFTADNILFVDRFDFSGGSAAINNCCAPINRSHPDALAYMIYTSGSTGKPKGVMVEHRAKLNFVHFIAKEWRLSRDSRICCHSSFSFDASIEDLYPVLTVGGALYIVPVEARKDLELLYRFICDNHITGGCYTTQIGAMLAQQYDLPLDYICLGGDKLTSNPDTKARVYNTYGPTEFTVDATYFELEHGKYYANIPIGRPVPNTMSAIVDSAGHLVPRGVEGELCLAGRQIARGYWNRPELTAEKFIDCPFIEGEKMYRTGDLARWNEEGELEYMGRIDHQVKLRGFRIELGEIESAMAKYEGIQSPVVEVKEINGTQHLCGYYTSAEAIDEEKLRGYLSGILTDYMAPTAFVRLESMPLTPNGKVNRKALPTPEIQAAEIVAPTSELEQSLFDIVSKLLATTSFGVTTNLISMGLTSMGAIKLLLAVQRELGLNLPTKDILQSPVIRTWTAQVDRELNPPKVYAKREKYPLLELQKVFYSVWEQHKECAQYNIPMALKLTGIDVEKLCASLKKVVEVHPYLKVRLARDGNEIVQVRHDDAPTHILEKRLDFEPDSDFFQSRVHPYNLLKDTLYRIEIYTSPKHTYLFMDFHHIIFDGGSLNILLTDMQKAYQGEELLPESVTAYDYALGCEEWMETEKYRKTVDSLRNLTDGVVPILYPPSMGGVGNGQSKTAIGSIPRSTIKRACQNLGVTENCFFLTTFMQVLHRATEESHILIETVANGRSSTHLSNSVGLFIQGLPIVSHQGEQSVAEVMLMMHNQLLEFTQQNMYSNPEFAEWYSRTYGYIGFTYQGEVINERLNLGAVSAEWIELYSTTVKAPIDLYIIPLEDSYQLVFEYDSGLYTEADMLRLESDLRTLMLAVATADPQEDITLI